MEGGFLPSRAKPTWLFQEAAVPLRCAPHPTPLYVRTLWLKLKPRTLCSTTQAGKEEEAAGFLHQLTPRLPQP